MDKLTSLLKKKKSRGDLSSTELQGKYSSTVSGSSISETVASSVAPLSLSIPTEDMMSSEAETRLSLMDDIMDELAGTTPNTPQPSQANLKSDLGDCGLSFELSRQLDLNASKTEARTSSSSGLLKVGKLDQNSAFKDNAFLRSQQQQQQQSGPSVAAKPNYVAPYRQTINVHGSGTSTVTSNNTTTDNTPSYLKSFSSREAEVKAEAAAKLREATKKANAQLPSDDEGSENSDSEPLEDGQEAERQKFFLQQQLEQHAGKAGSPRGKKPRPINHEAVIDRMKGRHRAALAGAAAAAREEYYEEYMDEYGLTQQMHSQGPMGFGMQYGMDPNMMYGMDDYRMQQQQQQQQQQHLYYGQNLPQQLPAHASGQYGHPQMSTMMSGYAYSPHGPMPSYGPGMQGPTYPGQGGIPLQTFEPLREQRPSISSSSDGSSHPMSNGGSLPSSRRGSRQQSTTSSARVSEDSWTEPSPAAVASLQRAILGDCGYGGMVEKGKGSLEESLEDIQESESEVEASTADDVAKVIEALSIAKDFETIADDEGDKSQADFSEVDTPDQLFEEPESIRSSTVVDSINGLKGIEGNSSSSSAPSAYDGNDGDDDIESSDDDQPIILSRRGSALGPFPLAKINMGALPNEFYDETFMSSTSGQMSYMQQQQRPTSMYQPQPMQGPSNAQPHVPYMPQQHQYIPMGYQFPAPPNPANMGHHHSYSVDRGTSAMMSGPHPAAAPGPSGIIGGGPMSHMPRRGTAFPLPGPKDFRQNPMSPGHNGSAAHYASASSMNIAPGMGPIQSQYPIPSTTLLHPLPRRSQSARVQPRTMGASIPRLDSPSRQQQQQQQQQTPLQPQRHRGSIEFVRLPNGGYQSIADPDFSSPNGNGCNGAYMRGYSEPLSPQLQQHQQHQQMMSPPMSHSLLEKHQQLQQGYYMAPTHVGYPMHPSEQYTVHSHQQILQGSRR